MKLRLIRHATLQIEFAGHSILVDPLLAAPGAFSSLTVGKTAQRNPTVPLPCSIEALLQPLDLVLVTHAHFDHFDPLAKERLPKEIPLICQPADHTRFEEDGFQRVTPLASSPIIQGNLQISRTAGKHGQGLIGRAMGPSSGFLIQAKQEPLLYIAGDTIWGPEVQATLAQYHPEIIVLNAGAAQFNLGAPITMTAADVDAVCRAAPQARVIAVHMEAINHCRLGREALSSHLSSAGLASRVSIPRDGEVLTA